MLHFLVLLATLVPTSGAACSVTALSPEPDTTITGPRSFTFQMTTDCVRSSFRITGVAGTKTPTLLRMVGGKRLMAVVPTAADWATWTDATKTTIPWKITANDAAGVSTTRTATAQLDLDADGWTRNAGDIAECDGDGTRNPGVAEVCDGLDNDCDGVVDDEGCVVPPIATLPLELLGADGTTASVTFPLSEADSLRPTLWLQIHDLDFDGEGSLQLNGGDWWELQDAIQPGDSEASSSTVGVTVLGAGAGYGGIGGLFATLKLEVDLPPGALVAGENTLSFRFNGTDGVTSGFRVLAFNLLDEAGAPLFTAEDFVEDDPDTWSPPFADPASLAEGERLWREAALTEPLTGAIDARCTDCHTQDGRDLAYFSYSNTSIIARSVFHGLSENEGELIASYIRSLDVPHPGRPWNPPYQPGPGLDSRPVEDWAAGAGLAWVLDTDEDALDYIFPTGVSATELMDGPRMNPREIPVAFQLLDWNHWLPTIAPQEGLQELPPTSAGLVPLDVFEDKLQRSYDGTFTDGNISLRDYFGSATPEARCANGYVYMEWFRRNFQWTRATFPNSPDVRQGQILYSTAQWWAVKKFEIHQEFELEGCGPAAFGATGEARSWFDEMFGIAPDRLHLQNASLPNYEADRPNVAKEYHDNAWWYLQLLQNDGHLLGNCTAPVDWGYVRGRIRELVHDSGVPEPGRMVVLLTRGMQDSTDAVETGVSFCHGWAPTANGSVWPLFHSDEQVSWNALTRYHQAELLDAYIQVLVANDQRFTPEEFWSAGDAFLSYPLADPTYLGNHAIDYVPHYLPESLAEQTEATLRAARDLGVPESTRQSLADWAMTVFPLIDWQALVDT